MNSFTFTLSDFVDFEFFLDLQSYVLVELREPISTIKFVDNYHHNFISNIVRKTKRVYGWCKTFAMKL